MSHLRASAQRGCSFAWSVEASSSYQMTSVEAAHIYSSPEHHLKASGSGVLSAFLASVVGPSALYLCTDVNPAAAQCTAKTAPCNNVSLQPVNTSLAECLLSRLSGKVDVLLFNLQKRWAAQV
ncbi:methyltransferase N6AMT1-like [Sander lucioperca]|uniref:methyltransferase N6AMT1-like n=1 Tax=Sander lucioperca TaxID=283035 RepID=UPI00165374FE|nr:methyltransferase N6AMT1-like [Sander lucioperca]